MCYVPVRYPAAIFFFLITYRKRYCLAVFRIRINLIRIQHLRLNAYPDPDLGFWWPKTYKNLQVKKKLIITFLSMIAIYLSLGLHKGRPSYRRIFQPSKKNIHHFKKHEIKKKINFCGSFLPFWIRVRIPNPDPDTDSLTWLNPDRDQIRNTAAWNRTYI